jgi:ubiquinone/menaquinone biosynthesis C-methylase UbiE
MASIIDDRGYNQGFELVKSTEIRMRRRTDLLISKMEQPENKSVMEIGCGTGEIAYWMAEKIPSKVLSTDLCVPFIEEAAKKYKLPNLRYEVLDFNKADEFRGETFDYIVGNGILHHLYYHLDECFINMRKLLKDNGRLIFMEPNIYNPYIYLIFSYAGLRKKANLEPDEMAFSKSFIAKKLEGLGYRDVKVEYRDFLLPGIPDFLITPSIVIGDVLEKLPLVNRVTQSIFITAVKKQG